MCFNRTRQADVFVKAKRLLMAISVASVSVLGAAANAAPIVYEGWLADGVPSAGFVAVAGTVREPSSDLSDYWSFFGNYGDSVTIVVRRLEQAFDPALWVFEGFITDDSVFGLSISEGDPGFLDWADDEISAPGPYGDPLSTFVLTLPGTGHYTAIVTNYASDPDDGDGLFPYTITATNVVNPPTQVSEPLSLILLGLGLTIIGLRYRCQQVGRVREATRLLQWQSGGCCWVGTLK